MKVEIKCTVMKYIDNFKCVQLFEVFDNRKLAIEYIENMETSIHERLIILPIYCEDMDNGNN